jgi:DNA-binding PadR family transcriptional regulator
VLLALLETDELVAADLVAELERLFGPAYRPSPGAVYPALRALVGEKLLKARRDGRADRYRITDLGRAALAKRHRQLDAIRQRTTIDVRADAVLRGATSRLDQAVQGSAGRADPTAVARLVDDATAQILKLTEGESLEKTN